MDITKRPTESMTDFTMRRIRAEWLCEARDRLMSIEPDMSALGEQHKIGFRCGHAAMRNAARDLLTEMIDQDAP